MSVLEARLHQVPKTDLNRQHQCLQHIWSIVVATSRVLLPTTNEVCEGYVFTGVCLSTGGGVSASLHAGIHPPLGRHPPGRHPPTRGRHPLCSACWDTVNKRAARIPLECILVRKSKQFDQSNITSDMAALTWTLSG